MCCKNLHFIKFLAVKVLFLVVEKAFFLISTIYFTTVLLVLPRKCCFNKRKSFRTELNLKIEIYCSEKVCVICVNKVYTISFS